MNQISIFGSKATVTSYSEVMSVFERWIDAEAIRQVCVSNVHTTMLGLEDPEFQMITNSASLVVMDGKPLVWIAKVMGYDNAESVTGPDLFQKACANSPGKGYRHFLYGGAQGVAYKVKRVLEEKYPGIKIVGTFSPPFRPLTQIEEAEMINMIHRARPHFLWVGLGAPKQEKWIYSNLDRIHVPIQVGIGAAFDFIAGTIKRAPDWMQHMGLEWLFRLKEDPRRLWRRYLVYNTKFVLKVIPHILLKRYFKGMF